MSCKECHVMDERLRFVVEKFGAPGWGRSLLNLVHGT